ncbi:UNVERIFIED_ORG: DNA replication protein DnaC [Burkholderia sp. CF145]
MQPVPALTPHLKQLRLSGILDSLEVRNRQAIDAKLSYVDFLTLLIEDEVARREQKKFASRLRRAAFRSSKTLEHFDFDRLPQLNRALVHDLAAGRYLGEHAPVLIVGPCGTGKSHLAQALGHCAVRQGIDVLFTTCTQLTASLNAARATGAYERRLGSLIHIGLLIIDDFGLKPLRPPARRRRPARTGRRTLRVRLHDRHEQPRSERMGPDVSFQPPACFGHARSPATQRLLPRARR